MSGRLDVAHCGHDYPDADTSHNDAAYIAAVNPQVVLRLIGDVRKLEADALAWRAHVKKCDEELLALGKKWADRNERLRAEIERLRAQQSCSVCGRRIVTDTQCGPCGRADPL